MFVCCMLLLLRVCVCERDYVVKIPVRRILLETEEMGTHNRQLVRKER